MCENTTVIVGYNQREYELYAQWLAHLNAYGARTASQIRVPGSGLSQR